MLLTGWRIEMPARLTPFGRGNPGEAPSFFPLQEEEKARLLCRSWNEKPQVKFRNALLVTAPNKNTTQFDYLALIE